MQEPNFKEVQSTDFMDSINLNKAVFGGLAAVSLIILQDLISSVNLDLALFISAIAFSVAIPLQVCAFVILYTSQANNKRPEKKIAQIILAGTAFGSYIITPIGVAAAIWHISWIAGTAFLVACLVALVASELYTNNLG